MSSLCALTKDGPYEDIIRKTALTKSLTMLVPWYQTASLQNREKQMFKPLSPWYFTIAAKTD